MPVTLKTMSKLLLLALSIALNSAYAESPKEIQKKTFSAFEGSVKTQTVLPLFQQAPVKSQGKIFQDGMILKFDQYPGIHDEKLQQGPNPQPRLSPNFRKLADVPIYGTGQPTLEELRKLLEETAQGGRETVWTNMREEPFVYIHGKPYNLRLETAAFQNMGHTGFSAGELERREVLLVQDILAKAAENNGKILLHDETPDMKLVTRWVQVDKDSVMTPRQVYGVFQREGFPVNYERLPITDEQAPEPRDLDRLLIRMRGNLGNDFIFNCHAGRGRTTTAIAATLMIWRVMDSPKVSFDPGKEIRTTSISDLLKILPLAEQAKRDADIAIDGADAAVNLRDEIAKNKKKASEAKTPEKAGYYQNKQRHAIKRYLTLIAFGSYLRVYGWNETKMSFENFLKKTPGVLEIINNPSLD